MGPSVCYAMLLYRHSLALYLGTPVAIPMEHILLFLLSGGFVCRFKTEKTQICFESLLTQLEGVTGNFQS